MVRGGKFSIWLQFEPVLFGLGQYVALSVNVAISLDAKHQLQLIKSVEMIEDHYGYKKLAP